MLGRRPEKEPGGKRKRKWEEECDKDSDDEDAEPDVTPAEMEEWRKREEEDPDERREAKQGNIDSKPLAATDAPVETDLTEVVVTEKENIDLAPASDRGTVLANIGKILGQPVALSNGDDAAAGDDGAKLPPPPPPLPPPPPPPVTGTAGLPGLPPQRLMGAVVGGPGFRLGEGDDRGRSLDEIRIIKEMLAQEILRFVLDNRIDEAAAKALRSEPPSVQFTVLDRGPLMHASNASGALVGRIRDAKRSIYAAPGGGAATGPEGKVAVSN